MVRLGFLIGSVQWFGSVGFETGWVTSRFRRFARSHLGPVLKNTEAA